MFSFDNELRPDRAPLPARATDIFYVLSKC